MTERLDLILQVFGKLDQDADGRLNEQELLKFARFYDFVEFESRWSEIYCSLCDTLGWDRTSGVGSIAFAAFVDSTAHGCYCEDELLRWMLEELCPKPIDSDESEDDGPRPVNLDALVKPPDMISTAAAMAESLRKLQTRSQVLAGPALDSRQIANKLAAAATGLMGVPGVAGIPGMSAADAAKLIAAGGKKPAGRTKPPSIPLRRQTWKDWPWQNAQKAGAEAAQQAALAEVVNSKTAEAYDPDLDPFGFDSPELDQMGIASNLAHDDLDPLGLDTPELDKLGIEAIGITYLKPRQAAEAAIRAETFRQQAVRPPEWLCEQFPKRKYWRSWRVCPLRVDEEVGAGLELEATLAGHRVHDVEHFPGQADALCAGTVIMGIDGQPLVGLSEELLDDAFDSHFRDGVEVMLMDWDELCEALDEKATDAESQATTSAEDSLAAEEQSTSKMLPPLDTWTRATGRRVLAGASQKQRKAHDYMESMAMVDDEYDMADEAPLDRFRRPGEDGIIVENKADEEDATDTEDSRQLFFDLAATTVTEICELPVETSFARTIKTYSDQTFQELHQTDLTPGAELKFTTSDEPGETFTPDEATDLRWMSLEERHAMEEDREMKQRHRRPIDERHSLRKNMDSKKPSQPSTGASFASPSELLSGTIRPKPASRVSMSSMPRSRPLGGAATRQLAVGGAASSSSSFSIGPRGYPLGTSLSSWSRQPADDEMGQFYSYRIPKSSTVAAQAKAQGKAVSSEPKPHEPSAQEAVDID